jgi:hypothetical protein
MVIPTLKNFTNMQTKYFQFLHAQTWTGVHEQAHHLLWTMILHSYSSICASLLGFQKGGILAMFCRRWCFEWLWRGGNFLCAPNIHLSGTQSKTINHIRALFPLGSYLGLCTHRYTIYNLNKDTSNCLFHNNPSTISAFKLVQFLVLKAVPSENCWAKYN